MKQYEKLRHGTEGFPVGIHTTVCENGFFLYPHIHREFEFLIMCEGSGVVYLEEEKFELNCGEGLFINTEKLHIGIKTNNERAVFFAVVFAPEVLGGAFNDTIMQKYVEPVLSGKVKFQSRIDKETVAILEEIRNKENTELEIKARLLYAWNQCLKNATPGIEVEKGKGIEEIKAVMEYIKKNFYKDLTLSELAEAANISKGYLCRRFSAVVHMTPFEYLNEIRVEKSCDLLKNTDKRIGDIAVICGFNSFSYFSKVFRKSKGCSPGEYRK